MHGVNAVEAIGRWPAPHAAAGVVAGGEPGHRSSAGDLDRRFAWASVTKLVTALAVLVAAEEGTVDLDQPAGPPGATVRHLLAHASGLGDDPAVPLAPPGTRRVYSNAGYEVLAGVVATGAGMAFEDYLDAAVLDPLGMVATRLEGSPAAGALGPVADLLRLAHELLAPTVVAPSTLADATRPAFADLAGVLPGFGGHSPNPWGLGPEIRGTKQPHWTGRDSSPATFGHFGRAGGFLWVDPGAGIACACLTDLDFGPWAAEAWPILSDAVLSEYRG
ncbi:MAG: beta-lactamase family protein [Actinomycetota bacterium]|nr:beta-lactamase family protein [Actinomycetota bacterium]